jgi:molybdopterin-binding protein
VEVFDKLDLQIGDEVTAFIKASDLSISEVCDG